jgi:hypothetical protein
MIRFYSFFILFILLLLLNAIQAQPLKEAKQAFQQGYFESAISHWQTVLATTQNTSQRLEAWFGIARAYQWLGLYKNAANTLTTYLLRKMSRKGILVREGEQRWAIYRLP